MINDMSFEDVRKLLDLTPNATCGFVRETYLSKLSIAPGGLPAPFSDGRPLGSALYFMLTPEEPVKLHRIRNDQLYHYYLGDPIEVVMMLEDGSTPGHSVEAPRNQRRVPITRAVWNVPPGMKSCTL